MKPTGMVLIISNDNDESTGKVINWMHAMGKKTMLLTDEEELIILNLNLSNISDSLISIRDEKLQLKDISSIWLRKGGLKLKFQEEQFRLIDPFMVQHIVDEWRTVENLILNYFNKLNRIGDCYLREINKLLMIEKAIEVGLEVPKSYVVSDKNELVKLFNAYKDLITKPMSNLFGYLNEGDFHIHYSTSVNQSDSINLPDVFFPLFVQEQVTRFFEVRVTAIKGALFPTAIIPQQSNVSDIRKLSKNQKRYLPHKLPEDIAEKLILFLESINCTYGCIDLIVTPEFRYYFLEVNPQGQYGAFAYYSGFNIDKYIAQLL